MHFRCVYYAVSRCHMEKLGWKHWTLLLLASICLLVDGAAILRHSDSRDDYEANEFLEEFRRQYLERRPQSVHSRDARTNDYDRRVAVEAASGDGVEGDDDEYRPRSPWPLQGRANQIDRTYRVAAEDQEDETVHSGHGNRDRVRVENVDTNNDDGGRLSGGKAEKAIVYDLQQSPDNRADVDDKFKVETRARMRQAPPPLNWDREEDPSEKSTSSSSASDVYYIAAVAGCSAAAIFGVMAAGFCWYKFQKNAKAAAEAEYPAYGITGPNREQGISPSSGGDRKLAQNANLFHYQHQKQQMIAMEKNNGERQVSTSDLDSEEENEEGDYTVYECPGLAPTGEMEVKNPLFQDEPTPSSPPFVTGRTPLNSGTSEDSSSK